MNLGNILWQLLLKVTVVDGKTSQAMREAHWKKIEKEKARMRRLNTRRPR